MRTHIIWGPSSFFLYIDDYIHWRLHCSGRSNLPPTRLPPKSPVSHIWWYYGRRHAFWSHTQRQFRPFSFSLPPEPALELSFHQFLPI